MNSTATTEPDTLGPLRGFNPTKAQDALIGRYLEKTGISFSRLMDMALKDFFEARSHEWPTKYGRRNR